jgi:hypothetical protein
MDLAARSPCSCAKSKPPAVRRTSQSRAPFQYAQPTAAGPKLEPLDLLIILSSFLRLPSHAMKGAKGPYHVLFIHVLD